MTHSTAIVRQHRLATIEEAAALLALPEQTIREQIDAGQLAAGRITSNGPLMVDIGDELTRHRKAEQLAAYVSRTVDSAPPLTPEQRSRIAALLTDGGATDGC